MRMVSAIYGQRRRSPEQVRRDGWREQGILAVPVDDPRLTWPERELVRQLGERLYGQRKEVDQKARNGAAAGGSMTGRATNDR